MAGEITSSIKYNNRKDGKAIAIKSKAGKIVHTVSKIVPWFIYLCTNGDFSALKVKTIEPKTQKTAIQIMIK
jgi:hypothetical protein